MPDPIHDKQTLRTLYMNRRRQLSRARRRHDSRLILDRLRIWLRQHMPGQESLLAYMSLPHEVDTRPILQRWIAYRRFAPRMHGCAYMEWRGIVTNTGWQRSALGFQEPTGGPRWRPQDRGILLCPLVAFDRAGHRIGMGKGCFDRWLAEHRRDLDAVVGLAFSCQECPAIPAESHDVPMDYVITEKEIIACPS